VLLIGRKLPRAGVLKWIAAATGALALLWNVLLFLPTSIVARQALVAAVGCQDAPNETWYCGVFRSEKLTTVHLAVVYLLLPLLAAFAGGALITWLTRYNGPSDREMVRSMTGMLQSELRELAMRFGAASSLPPEAAAELTAADRRKIARETLASVKKSGDRKAELQQELRRLNPFGLP
jgi:hypothetical protein